MNENLLKLFRFYAWPPIIKPIVWIMLAIYAPFYYFIPLYDKLLGRWKCDFCNHKFGVKTKRNKILRYNSGLIYRCEHCELADKLEKSK